MNLSGIGNTPNSHKLEAQSESQYSITSEARVVRHTHSVFFFFYTGGPGAAVFVCRPKCVVGKLPCKARTHNHLQQQKEHHEQTATQTVFEKCSHAKGVMGTVHPTVFQNFSRQYSNCIEISIETVLKTVIEKFTFSNSNAKQYLNKIQTVFYCLNTVQILFYYCW